MIPKIIHFVWVGPNPIPMICEKYIMEWTQAYSDYTVRIWRESDIDAHNLIPPALKEAYNDESMPHAFKADIARYLIVNKFGGIYLDTDFQYLRKIPDHFFLYDFLGAIQNNNQVNIGFFAAIPNTALINDVIDALPQSIQHAKTTGWYACKYLYKITGPEFFDSMSRKYFDNNRYVFFEPQYFYPYSWLEPHRATDNFYVTDPHAYAVHHWHNSWT